MVSRTKRKDTDSGGEKYGRIEQGSNKKHREMDKTEGKRSEKSFDASLFNPFNRVPSIAFYYSRSNKNREIVRKVSRLLHVSYPLICHCFNKSFVSCAPTYRCYDIIVNFAEKSDHSALRFNQIPIPWRGSRRQNIRFVLDGSV